MLARDRSRTRPSSASGAPRLPDHRLAELRTTSPLCRAFTTSSSPQRGSYGHAARAACGRRAATSIYPPALSRAQSPTRVCVHRVFTGELEPLLPALRARHVPPALLVEDPHAGMRTAGLSRWPTSARRSAACIPPVPGCAGALASDPCLLRVARRRPKCRGPHAASPTAHARRPMGRSSAIPPCARAAAHGGLPAALSRLAALNVVVMPFITHVVPHFGEEGQDPFELVRMSGRRISPSCRGTTRSSAPSRPTRRSAGPPAGLEAARRLGLRAIEAHWRAVECRGGCASRTPRRGDSSSARSWPRPVSTRSREPRRPRRRCRPASPRCGRSAGPRPPRGYGSTESAARSPPSSTPFPRPGDIGRELPTPWYETRLADDARSCSGRRSSSPVLERPRSHRGRHAGRIAAHGRPGELYARGEHPARGQEEGPDHHLGWKSRARRRSSCRSRARPYVSEVVAVGDGRSTRPPSSSWRREPVAQWRASARSRPQATPTSPATRQSAR